MVIRETFFAFLYRLCVLIFNVAAFVLLMINDQVQGSPLNGLRFYAEIVVLLTLLTMFCKTIINFIGLFKKVTWHRLAPSLPAPLSLFMLANALGLMFAHPLYITFLGTSYFASDALVSSLFAYIILPLILFIEWLLFEEKGTVKWAYASYAIMVPLFYFVITYITHSVHGNNSAYACGIFDPNSFITGNEGIPSFFKKNDGWNGVAFSSLSILLCQEVLALLLIFISNLLAGKYRKRQEY